MNICILIPAHNEAKNIGLLVTQLKAKGLDVVVVDDGSSDATGEIAKAVGAVVLTNTPNQGKGASLQRGFDYIISRPYEALITMDGDGQHAFEDIDKFVTLFCERSERSEQSEKGPDIICGDRMADHAGMPFVRVWTNRIMSGMISLVCRQRVHDTQCGYRLIRTDVLKSIRLSSSAFEIESEVLIKAAKKGYRIMSVPVRTIYAGEKSRVHPFFDTVRFIVYITREIFSR